MNRLLRPQFAKYRTWLFDCDGVLLDSNRLKTEAFRRVAGSYGDEAATRLVEYHVTHGGISRHVKFRHFQEEILQCAFDPDLQRRLVSEFAAISKALLLDCPMTHGCQAVLDALESTRNYVVSGGDEEELREVFLERGLDRHFTAICGSPRTKMAILDSIARTLVAEAPCLFVGDSRADHEAALHAHTDFLFVSRYTEFSGWRDYVAAHAEITTVDSLADLCEPS